MRLLNLMLVFALCILAQEAAAEVWPESWSKRGGVIGAIDFKAGAPPEAPADVMKATVLPRLLRRIEPEYQGEIWAITVRDHYVDVQTSLGKVSLLMRFSDAVEEVDGVPGGQVHRSHWVAWAGVGSVARDGGKVTLQLRNGDQIPVSRVNRNKVYTRSPPPAILNPAEVKGAA